MTNARRLLLVALVAAGIGSATPASAYELPVTVTYNPFVVCVTDPCPQPVPVTVCVKPLAYCTPK